MKLVLYGLGFNNERSVLRQRLHVELVILGNDLMKILAWAGSQTCQIVAK